MSKIYRAVILVADKFVPSKLRPLWEHEAGEKKIKIYYEYIKCYASKLRFKLIGNFTHRS